MDTFRHDDAQIVSILATFFSEGSLVPVLGSGFTAGEPTASDHKVPSGVDFRKIMLQQLSEHGAGLTPEELATLKDESFSEVSDIYFEPEICPQKIVKD